MQLPFTVVSTIVAEHDSACTVLSIWKTLQNIFGQTLGRLYHDQLVHRIVAGTHFTTQTSRSECQTLQQQFFQFQVVVLRDQLIDFLSRDFILFRAK